MSGGAQGLVVAVGHLGDGALRARRSRCSSSPSLVAASLARGGPGIELRAARQVPAAAAALGVATARRRLGAFVASAAIGGLAGGLAVQLAGVADASEYGPYLSFKLFVAVLHRRRRVGARAVGRHRRARRSSPAPPALLGALEGVESARFDPMLAALLLLAVLALGGEGIVPLVRAARRARREPPVAARRRRSSSAPAERRASTGPPSSSPSR